MTIYGGPIFLIFNFFFFPFVVPHSTVRCIAFYSLAKSFFLFIEEANIFLCLIIIYVIFYLPSR
jgi:hypothetical protein